MQMSVPEHAVPTRKGLHLDKQGLEHTQERGVCTSGDPFVSKLDVGVERLDVPLDLRLGGRRRHLAE